MLNFTCRVGVLFAKEAQTLFQHKLGKRKTFGLLQSEEYLPRINVFWTSVKDFVDTWFQVILWSFVRWSWSYFVSAHIRELKTGWLIAIWRVYVSDQCFLDFGEGFRGYLISLNFTKFCLQKLLTLCFSTYYGIENWLAYCHLTHNCLGSVFSELWWRILWILDFTCLDGVLLAKETQALF